jgi:peroxiredoxin
MLRAKLMLTFIIPLLAFVILVALFFKAPKTTKLNDDRYAVRFTLVSTEGGKVFAPLRGKNNLLIFFSNNCPSCNEDKKEWPKVMKIFNSKKIKIFGIAEKKARAPFQVLLDKQRVVSKLYSVNLIPDYILVDKKGLIVQKGTLKDILNLLKGGEIK